jgi:predicted secreted protein
MRIRIFAAIAAALFPLLAAAGEAPERSETWREAQVNAPFEIALVSNPSTGYGWQIDTSASSGLERIEIDDLGTSPQPQRDGEPLIGAPVIHSWLVTPSKAGSAKLVLIYVRPSEPLEKTHVFHVEISE